MILELMKRKSKTQKIEEKEVGLWGEGEQTQLIE